MQQNHEYQQSINQTKGMMLAKQLHNENAQVMREQIKAYLSEEIEKIYPGYADKNFKIVQRLANFPIEEIRKYLMD